MMTLQKAFVFAVLCGMLAGCELVNTGSSTAPRDPDDRAVVGELEVDLQAPAAVAAGSSFAVEVAVQNPTADAIDITTPNSCLVTVAVVKADGERVPLEGSVIGCAEAISSHTIAAQETVSRTFAVEAVLPSGEPVATGPYAVQAQLRWSFDGTTRHFESRTLERALKVADVTTQ